MKSTSILVIAAVLAATSINLYAAEENTEKRASGTNIIGSQEAPNVLNVVPWKDRKVKLEKKDPTSSVLDRVLEPLDRDVLLREVEYYKLLNEDGNAGGEDGLFLE